MNSSDPVVLRQLPVIHKIIRDETWLEGERRGCHVAADDPVVRENVCRVILLVGQQLRDSLMEARDRRRDEQQDELEKERAMGG